ncbi:MAG: hypothetical protein KDI09_15250, partial [Halioglobus sp.]|nr:hypothetical protein [Halioglobus sp.]
NARSLETVPEINGATGRLYLDDKGRVHRRLAWARFERGQPVAMPADFNDGRDRRIDDTDDEPLNADPDDEDGWNERSPGG